jgi:hypothetical protein
MEPGSRDGGVEGGRLPDSHKEAAIMNRIVTLWIFLISGVGFVALGTVLMPASTMIVAINARLLKIEQ